MNTSYGLILVESIGNYHGPWGRRLRGGLGLLSLVLGAKRAGDVHSARLTVG
jgi:hypothetical protein